MSGGEKVQESARGGGGRKREIDGAKVRQKKIWTNKLKKEKKKRQKKELRQDNANAKAKAKANE